MLGSDLIRPSADVSAILSGIETIQRIGTDTFLIGSFTNGTNDHSVNWRFQWPEPVHSIVERYKKKPNIPSRNTGLALYLNVLLVLQLKAEAVGSC